MCRYVLNFASLSYKILRYADVDIANIQQRFEAQKKNEIIFESMLEDEQKWDG